MSQQIYSFTLRRAWGVIAGWLLLFLFISVPSHGQNQKYEMRGAWVATVFKLDWPLSVFDPPSVQKADMATLFDELSASGINAIFFQIRSESDAMYASPFEPWSRHLTGLQGRAPDPFYDPLQTAIDLAHERGMELHAWMNPFRAVAQTGAYSIASDHVSTAHPEWIIEINSIKIINPGIPEATQYIVDVVTDIVTRYEVDGIHFDDYFYPYPPNMMLLEDDDEYTQFGAGYLNIADWRRDNINFFVGDVYSAIKDVDESVKFGISPFGIWKDGVPAGISGLSSYDVLFADATAWLEEELVDYLVPQLYWPFGGAQDFEALAEWWVEQADGIHIYPGIAAYKVDAATAGSSRYAASEIPLQIEFSRATAGIEGNVFFRARNLGPAANLGLTDALSNGYYSTKAFSPPMLYADVGSPNAPENFSASQDAGSLRLTWETPSAGFAAANKFGVYRVRSDAVIPNSTEMTNDPANLLSITWNLEYFDTEALEVGARYYYAVTAVTANSIEGPETGLVDIMYFDTDVESLPQSRSLSSLGVFPNPASSRVNLELELEQSAVVSIRIFDMLGREVANLLDGSRHMSRGLLRRDWNLSDTSGNRLPAGAYYIVAQTEYQRLTRSVVILR